MQGVLMPGGSLREPKREECHTHQARKPEIFAWPCHTLLNHTRILRKQQHPDTVLEDSTFTKFYSGEAV